MQIQTALLSAPTETDNGLLVRALCLYEGEFQPMQGKPIKFTAARIKKIAAESQKHLNSGQQVAVFASDRDHGYSQTAKVGIVEGPYETKVIAAEDLPHPGLTDLIGKTGLFTKVRLTKDQAIADFKAKVLRPISAGIDLLGETYSKFADAIFEISGVSFSAVRGAALFAGTAEYQDAIAQFAAMNFNDELVRKNAYREIYRIQEAFMDTYREIIDAEEDDLEQPRETLLSQMLADYSKALADRLLSVPPNLSPATVPPPPIQLSMNTEEDDDPMADEKLTAELAAATAQIELLTRRDKIATLSARVNSKARKLFDQQKITPEHLAQIETGAGTADEAIAKFSATAGDPNEAIAALERLEIQLEGIEQFAQPIVEFGSRIGSQPLPAGPGAASPEQIEKEAEELVTVAFSLPRLV